MDRRSTWARILLAILSLSAPSDVPDAFAADPRDIELGRRVAAGAVLAPEHTCARCHGALGEGNSDEGAPRIAGQPRFYLEKQLRDFAEGTRQSEKMAPVARALSEERRAAVAAYYGSLWAAPYPEMPFADPALIQQGGVLSAIGDEERGVRACEICHADAGVGIPPSFPYLAGQDAAYTERQLQAWKHGARRNDPLEVMAAIAKRLSDQEMRALAHYFARVRPPPSIVSSPIPDAPIPPPPEEPSLPD